MKVTEMKKNANRNIGTVALTPSERLSNRLQRVLKRLMKEHNEDTTITLNEFIDEIPKADPDEIVSLLDKSKIGEIIEGRRGFPTRFVFGDSWTKWINAMAYRRQWRKDNGRDPLTGRLLRPAKTKKTVSAPYGQKFRKVVLRVPAGVEVVAA